MESHPYIGASPDGDVYDPSSEGQEYGFLEIKCPYTHRDKFIEEACSSSGFCSELRGHDNKPSLLSSSTRSNGSRRASFVSFSQRKALVWNESNLIVHTGKMMFYLNYQMFITTA